MKKYSCEELYKIYEKSLKKISEDFEHAIDNILYSNGLNAASQSDEIFENLKTYFNWYFRKQYNTGGVRDIPLCEKYENMTSLNRDYFHEVSVHPDNSFTLRNTIVEIEDDFDGYEDDEYVYVEEYEAGSIDEGAEVFDYVSRDHYMSHDADSRIRYGAIENNVMSISNDETVGSHTFLDIIPVSESFYIKNLGGDRFDFCYRDDQNSNDFYKCYNQPNSPLSRLDGVSCFYNKEDKTVTLWGIRGTLSLMKVNLSILLKYREEIIQDNGEFFRLGIIQEEEIYGLSHSQLDVVVDSSQGFIMEKRVTDDPRNSFRLDKMLGQISESEFLGISHDIESKSYKCYVVDTSADEITLNESKEFTLPFHSINYDSIQILENNILFCVSNSQEICLFDFEKKEVLAQQNFGWMQGARIINGNQLVIHGKKDITLHEIDLQTGEITSVRELYRADDCFHADFLNDGRLLVSEYGKGTFILGD